MRIATLLFSLISVCILSNSGFAQHGGSGGAQSFSQTQDVFVSAAEEALVPVAEAMPEAKYSFAPSNGQFKGVRTFGNMVKHAALANYGLASAILHQDPPVRLQTQADVDAIATKADIVKFLKGSFEFLHKAVLTIDEKNATELITSPDSPNKPLPRIEVAERATSHCWNHYGQLIEYLRMNGIAPPGSH